MILNQDFTNERLYLQKCLILLYCKFYNANNNIYKLQDLKSDSLTFSSGSNKQFNIQPWFEQTV